MAYTNIVFSHFEVVYCSKKKRYIDLQGNPFECKFEAEGWGFGVNKKLSEMGAPSICRLKMRTATQSKINLK